MLKRFLPTTLFGRALAIIVTPVILLQVIATYVFYERHWDSVTRRLALGLAGDIATIIDLQAGTPSGDLSADLAGQLMENMQIQATFLPGEILPNEPQSASVTNRILDRMLNGALDERIQRPYRIDTATYGENVEVRVQLKNGLLRILTPRKRVSSPTTYIFVMWMVGASLILLTIAILFLRNQIRPIRRLAEAADRFGKGQEAPDLKPSGATEVRQAAVAFTRMRDRIERQIDQRTEMLAGVSHDLRTPLTRMKLQLAMLDGGEDLASLNSDISDMERMIDGYLAFARGQDTEVTAEIDLARLVGDVVEEAKRQGGDLVIDTDGLTPKPDEGYLAFVRPVAFKRCLANLINNASRHAEHVMVSLSREGDYLEVAVDDDGPGIPAEQRAEVFQPFKRLEESRNPETGGTGLGLAIARDVVRSHGGDIILSDAPLGGLRALVRLPA